MIFHWKLDIFSWNLRTPAEYWTHTKKTILSYSLPARTVKRMCRLTQLTTRRKEGIVQAWSFYSWEGSNHTSVKTFCFGELKANQETERICPVEHYSAKKKKKRANFWPTEQPVWISEAFTKWSSQMQRPHNGWFHLDEISVKCKIIETM